MLSKSQGKWLPVALLAGLLLSAHTAWAAVPLQDPATQQGQVRRAMSTEERLNQLAKELNLTADQQAQLKPLLENEQNKMRELRNNAGDDRQATRQQAMQLRQQTQTQIRDLLNESQKQKFDQRQQQRRSNRGRRDRTPPQG